MVNYSWKFETRYDRKFKQDPNNFRVRSFLSNRKQRVRIGNSKNKLPTSKWWRPTGNCPRSYPACLCIMSMIFGKRLEKRVEICTDDTTLSEEVVVNEQSCSYAKYSRWNRFVL